MERKTKKADVRCSNNQIKLELTKFNLFLPKGVTIKSK